MKELTKEYISSLIEQSGMTKTEFAAKMGYTQRQYLDAVLNNKKKDIATVVKMAEILNIPLLDFIGVSESAPEDNIHGCIYINNTWHQINNKEELVKLINAL